MNTEILLKSPFLDGLKLCTNDFVVFLNGEVTSKSANEISSKLFALDKMGLDFIPFLINSEGGDVDALNYIVASMENLVTPVATINMSRAISAAAVIFCMGSKGLKYMGPNTYLMWHEASMSTEALGKTCDMKAVQDHFSKVDKSFNKKVAAHLNLDKDFFENFGHVDTYISAKDALKQGLCDVVGYPTLKIHFSLGMSIEVRKGQRVEIPDPEKRPYKYQKYICDQVAQREFVEEDD